ncbi:MAG: cell division protein FtsX [Rhodobacteraceae bacterium]|nr:cell division protein FtsX [Paracoccaceae bacterium]
MRLPAALRNDTPVGRIVPPSGAVARLTPLTAAAMAFLAVLALAVALAAGRIADRWETGLAGTATVRISAPPDQMAAQVRGAIRVLETTQGVTLVREMSPEDRQALLAPWVGQDLPLDTLPLPAILEVVEGAGGVDAQGLRLRLAAEVPGAVYDDHARWREPLVQTARGVRVAGIVALGLIGAVGAVLVAVATQAALAENLPVIRTLRLIGARDAFIARAFVRRVTLRTSAGAAAGAVAGVAVLALVPDAPGGLLAGIAPTGADWLWPLLVPVAGAAVAFAAARMTAFRLLRRVP